MKKYIIAVMLGLLLPTVSYAKCCDCCQDKYASVEETTTTIYGLNGHAIGVATIKSFRDTGIEKLIGKIVHRIKPIICAKSPTGHDRSWMDDPRKLLAVTDKYLILSSDILESGHFELNRDIWDDGNWEEVKSQRLTVTEIERDACIGNYPNTLKYACVRCGKRLNYSPCNRYYCIACNTGFDIKEE